MHQHSKNLKIRGYSKGNSHVLEIVEKVVFLAEKAMISDFFFWGGGGGNRVLFPRYVSQSYMFFWSRETLHADTELLSPSL